MLVGAAAGWFGGRIDAGTRARIRNKEIGFIFQAFNLIGDLTVSEKVELPLDKIDEASLHLRKASARLLVQRDRHGRLRLR